MSNIYFSRPPRRGGVGGRVRASSPHFFGVGRFGVSGSLHMFFCFKFLIKILIQKNICEVKPVQKHRFLFLEFEQEFDAKKHL